VSKIVAVSNPVRILIPPLGRGEIDRRPARLVG
jgi:hypothetical protein